MAKRHKAKQSEPVKVVQPEPVVLPPLRQSLGCPDPACEKGMNHAGPHGRRERA